MTALIWLSIALAAPNPHGDADACASCHEAAAAPDAQGDVVRAATAESTVGPAKPIIATCLGCHPTADMHPVGMPPDEVSVNDWPLEDGLVTCATCHLEPAHEGNASAAPPYHRGGPYTTVTEFCYSCHEPSKYKRADPHHPADARNPTDGSCAACHSGQPETGASPEQSKLRTAASGQCRTCHEDEVHTGVATHVDVSLDPARRAGLPSEVPVSEDGKVQCWSCHEVHRDRPESGSREGGVLRSDLRAAAMSGPWAELAPYAWPGEAPDPEHSPMLALGDQALCISCHGEGP